MMNDSSSGISQSAFDFNTEVGVAGLLLAIRTADLSPAIRNDLRDTVLQYISGGKDESTRLALEKALAAYALKPSAATTINNVQPLAKEAPAPQYPFGTSRPTPQFRTPATTVAQPTTSTPAQAHTVIDTKVPPVPTQPVVPTVQFTATPSSPISPPVSNISTPPPFSTQVPTPIYSAPVTANSLSPEESMERIREIKSIVNEKIGNPVNLIDIDNIVGREYMSALLDAMKRASAAQPTGAAMQRLEAAYQAVEQTLASHSVEVVAQTTPREVTFPPINKTTPETTDVIAGAWSTSETRATPVAVPTFVPPTPEVSVPLPETPSVVEQAPVETIAGRWGSEMPPRQPPQPKPKLSSLADLPSLKNPDVLPDAASLTTASIVNDPLFTREVDDGLEQLLLEWPIFKKSGLFGTGPKGREHPLFKKIAPLQIPLLLAGRFEGASQEIRQSITDYMNGWRYEQGLIYEQDESFEHYLRRVIRHILDLQKPK